MLNAAPIDPVPPKSDDLATVDDGIEQGKRLIRLPSDTALTISERIANQITRLTWRTPLHALRLKGRNLNCALARWGPRSKLANSPNWANA